MIDQKVAEEEEFVLLAGHNVSLFHVYILLNSYSRIVRLFQRVEGNNHRVD